MTVSHRLMWLVSTLLIPSACSTANPEATPPAPASAVSGASGFYSAEQAARGRTVFESICSECHDTGDFRGPDFEWEWRRQTAWDLYETMVETMPEDAPGSLTPEAYTAVIAYILQLNEYAVGATVLLPEQTAMETVPLGANVNKTRRSGKSGAARS